MRVAPGWPVAVGVYLIYNAIIYATWAAVGADYTDLVSEGVALRSLVLPMSLGAVFVVMAVTFLGWWRPVRSEAAAGGPRWAMWLVLAAFGAFVAANLAGVRWSAMEPAHVATLVAAGILVGFNEEAIARGVLVTGVRGSAAGEWKAWFWSSFLFGAMHVPNAMFGIPLVAGLVQCVFAFVMGGAFYVARRVSGTIYLPMVLHGAWDFSSFSVRASGGAAPLATPLQFATYVAAVVAVVVVLRHERRRPEG